MHVEKKCLQPCCLVLTVQTWRGDGSLWSPFNDCVEEDRQHQGVQTLQYLLHNLSHKNSDPQKIMAGLEQTTRLTQNTPLHGKYIPCFI